ncbi:MAG: TlpA family protein disulfide reductase [Saprospiraceae bacterium]|nr:TlpA family protein disulfide reductase [Saprospiraceae bacterium]
MLYEADGSKPVKGALAMKALFYNGFGGNGGIKKNEEKARNLAKEELAAHPSSITEVRFANACASLGLKLKDETLLAAAKTEVERLTKSKKASDDELRRAVSIATALEDKTLAESLKKRADEAFPKGQFGKSKAKDDFKAASTVEEKLKVYNAAKALYAKEKDMERFLNTWAGTIAGDYAKADDWVNFEKLFAQITDPKRAAGELNGLAWTMSGESIEAEGKNLKKALELAARSLEMLQKEIDSPTSRPISTSPKTWARNLEFSKAMNADTYALLLYKNGDHKNALKYQTIACEKNDFADGEMNERYAVFYEKNNSAKETEAVLTKFIAEGKATTKMLEQHKRLFLANNSLESAYEKYVASLEKEAKAKKRADIEAKMLNENAPAFKLRNLKGEAVSLESLRGKVLVLDFWATWCGPCKASFPGMQQAVNKYAGRNDVEFLFIDTWERVDDKQKAAGDFIAANSYTFNVLMDLDNAVVTSFGVSGIPTKFVVDGNGKIRFKAVGFNGNDKELVEELSTMIELAGGGVTP